MPRDNDKHNSPSRGRPPGGGKGASKGRSGAARGPEKKFAKRDGKPFEGRAASSRDGEKRPYTPRSDAPRSSGEKSYGKKPYSGPGKPYAGKREGPAPARSFSDRPKRDFSERPSRDFNDRPKRDFSDRPKRDFSERPARSGGDRPAFKPREDRAPRSDFRPRDDRPRDDRPRQDRPSQDRPRQDRPRDGGGDKRPYTPRGDRPPHDRQSDRPSFKPREDRAPRGEGRNDSRPAGRFADKKFGEKRPYTPRGESDRPAFKPRSDRPQGDRPSFKPRGDRPPNDRQGDRPAYKPREDRAPRRDFDGPDRSDSKPWEKREPRGDRPAFARDDRAARNVDKPRFDRPRSDRSDVERKPREDRGGDERPRFQRPRDDRPQFDLPQGDRPVRGRSDWQEHPRNERGGDDRPRRDNEDDSKVFAKRPAFGGRGEYRERKPDERRPPRAPAVKKPGERIAKIVARAGLCSRRDAEDWITQGRVAVNGRVINSPALDITTNDVVTIDGRPLPAPERTRLFMFHKPRGLMTTHADPEGRPTVFDNLPDGLPRLISIGRLDFNTEGLLLLTNDGGLARTLELPDTGWLRRYRVRAHGEVTQAQLDELRNGVEVDGIKYGAIDAQLERDKGANVWLVFAIREGKNREVRNVLAHLGLEVNRLIRISYGPFQLGEIEEGQVEEVKTRVLREQLGEKIATASGADFARQLPSKGDVSLDPVVTKKTPLKRGAVKDSKGRRVLVQRAGSEDARARNEDDANGYGPPKRPKRGYHGKRDIAPREE